jgi:hypothetical protein
VAGCSVEITGGVTEESEGTADTDCASKTEIAGGIEGETVGTEAGVDDGIGGACGGGA